MRSIKSEASGAWSCAFRHIVLAEQELPGQVRQLNAVRIGYLRECDVEYEVLRVLQTVSLYQSNGSFLEVKTETQIE